jgi:hypothetical protein
MSSKPFIAAAGYTCTSVLSILIDLDGFPIIIPYNRHVTPIISYYLLVL